MDQLDLWLRHPMALLIVGAMLSGVIAPWLIRTRQLRGKRLEIKVSLIAEMSELVMRMMMAVEFVYRKTKSYSADDLHKAYLDWEVGSALLGTKLQAYLSSRLPEDWSAFSETLTSFYELLAVPDEQRKDASAGLRARVKDYVEEGQNQADWVELRKALLAWKAQLIERLMNADLRLAA